MNKRILLVDDEENILSGFKRNLRKNFDITTASSGPKGIELIKKSAQFAAVVSDYRMPEMDGNKFLSTVRGLSPETVRILLTGYADVKTAIDSVNEGNVFRLLTKPCPPENLINVLDAAVEQYRLLTAEKELLGKTLKGSIKVLVDILSVVNPFAFSQAARYRNLSRKIGLRLGIDDLWEIEIASLLSQIGSVGTPSEILQKKYRGEPLNNVESKLFLSHPQTGSALLKHIPRLENIAEAVAYQLRPYDRPEMYDDNITGANIPIIARILKVVIDFDYLINTGNMSSKAFGIMRKNSGRYDPEILSALESELSGVEEGYIVRSLSLNELNPGMILSEDIKNNSGFVLVPKGCEISEVMKIRLINFSKMGKIAAPIKILDPVK